MRLMFLVLASLLVWTGFVTAGELKIQIPVSAYEEIRSRLEILENENNQLKQEVETLNAAKEGGSQNKDMESSLTAMEAENSQLKAKVKSLENVKVSASQDSDLDSRLADMEKENNRLKLRVKALKEGRAANFYTSDTRSARQMYSAIVLKTNNHVYK
ncbi:MAG: hypothetical protein KKB30_16160 [Proteobacteria bacterium]|nr:hypothetical protein [Pseudomonadota bacterium]MBU1714141.1 hypothetical protein [Pseudomonadota bacterium]